MPNSSTFSSLTQLLLEPRLDKDGHELSKDHGGHELQQYSLQVLDVTS